MAKKVVASIQKKGAKEYTKVVKPIISKKSGCYSFKEEMIPNASIEEYLKK
ncbi:MAG: DUF4295 family protein [Bacteroidales bacterium]